MTCLAKLFLSVTSGSEVDEQTRLYAQSLARVLEAGATDVWCTQHPQPKPLSHDGEGAEGRGGGRIIVVQALLQYQAFSVA